MRLIPTQKNLGAALLLAALLSPLLFLNACSSEKKEETASDSKPRPVVIGYVGGFHGLLDTDNIEAKKLTHINYAFIDIKNGKAFLSNEKTDTTNFRKLNLLKTENPELKILISIGGWAWSEHFSDAVLTDSSRKIFAKSSVDIIKKIQPGRRGHRLGISGPAGRGRQRIPAGRQAELH